MSTRRPRLGWYVHHQGAGHTSRLLSISRQLDADIVAFSSAPRPELPPHVEWVGLERDDTVEYNTGDYDTGEHGPGEHAPGEKDARGTVDPHRSSPDARGLLHWAPLHHRGHRSRLARIAQRIETDRFDAFVVDVSAEVTVLARLLGVPTVIITQPGDRSDRAHQLAIAAAEAVIAPWPGELYRPRWLGGAAADRVHYVGGVARFEGRPRTASPVAESVLLMAGAGGSTLDASHLEGAVAATPGYTWQTLGVEALPSDSSTPWAADPFDALCRAGVVVSWAGQNAITDLAAVDARAIVIAQPRPFREQQTTAHLLAEAGLAVVLPEWPRDSAWPQALRRAAQLRPDWTLWQTDGAAARAASVIERIAAT